MLATSLIVLTTLTLAPSMVSAGMFPKDSLVKPLDVKTFKQAMKANETSMVAFVAPWCGHCQKMVPEYSKAALGLHPLVPVYSVNCHAEKNKRLCAEQGVQGFPTVKLFPRGLSQKPTLFEGGERSASALFYFATRGIPKAYTKIYQPDEIESWVIQYRHKHRALLLNKDKKVPLLWQVLANKYSHTDLALASHRDRKGRTSVQMKLEEGGAKDSKVLLYPAGSDKYTIYSGINKMDSLSKFFDSVLAGTANLTQIVEEAKSEQYIPDEKEVEIEEQQEAQRIALLHGGFTDLIDFEKALKNGGANFHDSNGFGGIGNIPEHFKKQAPKTESQAPSMSSGTAPTTTPPRAKATASPQKDEL
ncbi:thioredoxin-like protein [Gymnopilus junonius]|uniref:Thioredoxin-like protein n=1 Tax=Gymnopilus junonius TaxID=109634 RepID=A0A9P5NEI3_GYMJU|nr:thioredoxin-like protein [Gymnopilus junonius]